MPGSAQALASKVEPMGIVDEAIEHGVGIGRSPVTPPTCSRNASNLRGCSGI